MLLTLFGTGASAQLKVGNLLKAGGNLISAVTLTDADIAEMSKSAVEKMDQENQVDTSDYHRRLQRLTENISVDGLKPEFQGLPDQRTSMRLPAATAACGCIAR